MTQQLSQTQQDKIVRSLQAKLGTSTCPTCRKGQLVVNSGLYIFTSVTPDGKTVEVLSGFPVIVTFCDHCGFVMPFSASSLGIV